MEYEPRAERARAMTHRNWCLPRDGSGRALQTVQFIPIRFTFFNKLTKDDRLLVAFGALVSSRTDWEAMSVWAGSSTPQSFQRSFLLAVANWEF
jgi:hypothetical protein